MNKKEAVEEMKRIHPKTCKMVNGRLQGGFDDHESESGIAFDIAIKAIENEAVSKKLLEAAAEEIENLYGRDTELTIKIRDFLKV